MAIRIQYSKAEKASFKIQPETCPALDAVCDSVRRIDIKTVIAKLAAEGIEIPKNKEWLIADIVSSQVFAAVAEVQKVAMYQGTFPLRAALVEKIEAEMIASGELSAPERNHFREWIADRKRMDEFSKQRTQTGA